MSTHTTLLSNLILLCLILSATTSAGPVFVPGFVPDWNQPYTYDPSDPNCLSGGPGPDPTPGVVDPWNAWCAPTSAANVAGHWGDYHGMPVADGVACPNSATAWAAGPDWQDYLADGTGLRPDPNDGSPPPLPPLNWPTDIGYCMDTNQRGNPDFSNGPHAGTYLKDIHAGLLMHLQTLTTLGVWTTGTQGRGFAAGNAPAGGPAVLHPAAAAAFAEIVAEIDAGRAMIVCFSNWGIQLAGYSPLPGSGQGEASFPVHFYAFGRGNGDPWENDEEWNYDDGAGGLGHAVTAVGYLMPGDALNPEPGTPWVIVHDNVQQTPRNVAVPVIFPAWVANTNAVHSCPGDLDADEDIDLSDLGIVVADYGCTGTCPGDVNGDGITNLADLMAVVQDWGCPLGNTDFDNEPATELEFSIAPVDNSAVGLGDDPLAPEFDGGVTHFTFDLQVTVSGGDDWTATDAAATLTEPGLTFFSHSMGDNTPPLGVLVSFYPALEYDSFCASTEIMTSNQPPLGDPSLVQQPSGSQTRDAVWCDVPPNGGSGVSTIARYTIVVPPGSNLRLIVVPPGSGGPPLGTLTGAATCTVDPDGLNMFAYEIARCPDFDDSGAVDLPDLAQLLANYGMTSGAGYEDGDLDGDEDVDLADLAALLALYGDACL
jgi:hypothetical protein